MSRITHNIAWTEVKKMYFIGIGGIGMSALARFFNDNGIDIYGYDRTETNLTKQLEGEGIKISYRDEISQIPPDIEYAVYTPAIPDDNRILKHIRSLGIPINKRAEVLGDVVSTRRTIAIAGTHGKTTTSGMTSYLLRACGEDATAILGGIIPQFGSNYVHGNGPWVVVEADEYDRSFLHLHPEIAVVTSIDPDHLDIYGDPKSMYETYLQFMSQVHKGGHLILHWKVAQQLPGSFLSEIAKDRMVTVYGKEDSEGELGTISYRENYAEFDWKIDNKILPTATQMPGLHNVSNALAAMHACKAAGADILCLTEKLPGFSGIWRRFEKRYEDENHLIIDDYAHHPTELEAAIDTARKRFPERKITGIFQPHLYTRTRDFYEGFAKALDALDEIWLLDIYPAREQPIPGVNSGLIMHQMRNANVHLASKDTIAERIAQSKQEVILVLGAGDLHLTIPQIIDQLTKSKI